MFFAATTLFVVVAVVAKLGTPTGLVYWLARLRALGEHDLLRRCLRVALAPVLIAATGIGAAMFAGADRLAGLAGGASPEDVAEFADQLRILAAMVPLAALAEGFLAATRGHRLMRATVLVDKVGRTTLQLAGLTTAVLVAASTNWFTLAWAAPWAVTAVAAWLWLRTLLPPTPPTSPTPSRSWTVMGALATTSVQDREEVGVGRRFWGFAWARGVANVLQLVLQRLDILLVAGMLGFAPAALYTAATRFVIVGQLGNQALGAAVEPRIAEAMARGNRAGARALYQGATAWLVLVAWPIYLLTAIFAPLYLGLFGPAYATDETVTVVVLLCGAMLFASGCGMVDVVLAMTGRTTWNLANVGVALTLNVILNLLLIPRLGIVGAAVAWAAATLVKNALPLAQLGFRRGLHPFGTATLVAAALAVGCFGVPPLLLVWTLGAGAPTLLAAAGAGALCYAAGLWRLRGPLGLDAFRALRRSSEEVR